MSEYLSFDETLKFLKIQETEIFDFLEKGLQPYNSFGEPVPSFKLASPSELALLVPNTRILIQQQLNQGQTPYCFTPEARENQIQNVLSELHGYCFKTKEVEELKSRRVIQQNIISSQNTFSNNMTIDSESTNDSKNEKIVFLSGYLHIKAFLADSQQWEEFYFNDRQAKIVKELHNSPNNELHIQTLLKERIGLVLENYRLDKQLKNHPNWKKLIIKTRRGYWRLNI